MGFLVGTRDPIGTDSMGTCSFVRVATAAKRSGASHGVSWAGSSSQLGSDQSEAVVANHFSRVGAVEAQPELGA